MKRVIFAVFSGALLVSACGGGFTEIGEAGGGSAGTSSKAGSSSGGSNMAGASSAECQVSDDCVQPGAPCQQCSDGSYACATVECVAGECVGSFPTCSGTVCEQDRDCPQLGAPCQACADGSSACPYSRCTNGLCESGIEACPDTQPCANKACGDGCNLCPPGQACPAVVMYCDEQQQCQFNRPACGNTGCQVDDDCPQVDACPACPVTGVCAEMRCVSGSCQFECPGGSCGAQGDSCANGETCCAGLECCSGVPVPEGQEFCGQTCPISDVNMKSEFASVDQDQVLAKLAKLSISTWVYKTETSEARHIGPMAQDFMAAFGVGSSDRTILQVDADGVAFAAIKALHQRLERLEKRNAELEREVQSLKTSHH